MGSMWKLKSRLVALATLTALTTPIFAQESRASLSGTITDPSGSAITGARLTLTNIDTAVAFTAERNNDHHPYSETFGNSLAWSDADKSAV